MAQELKFFKYQGAGNDFVLVDQRRQQLVQRGQNALIQRLCDRRFGIGADGLILIEAHADCDFEMIYFNADGGEGSLCGNGGRCAVAFAHYLGMFAERCRFMASDGPHEARLIRPNWVELQMADISDWEQHDDYVFMDTGSPHYVQFVNKLSEVNVVQAGRAIRYNDRFCAQGTNVNFVQRTGEGLSIATYERGVEDETLACGTGVTAAALSDFLAQQQRTGVQATSVQARGGLLEVRFQFSPERGFTDIWLCGPAVQVFSGKLTI